MEGSGEKGEREMRGEERQEGKDCTAKRERQRCQQRKRDTKKG